MRNIIIDCDPGVDDTLAIVLANSVKDVNILAINPVHGNVPYEYTAENTRKLVRYLNMDVVIGTGAVNPMIVPPRTAGTIHGNNGLGGFVFPDEEKEQIKEYAWDLLYRYAKELNGDLDLITLGPLTNVAISLLAHPDLKQYIKSITTMGGSGGRGNTNPYAEFNIFVDPHAAEIVVKSGIPIYMCGLDGNDTCALTAEETFEIFGTESRITPLTNHIGHFIDERNKTRFKQTVNNINDLTAMACYLHPEIAEFEEVGMKIDVYNEDHLGQTVISEGNNVHFLRKVNKKKYLDILRECMASYK